ncbi:hypothetical protein ACE6H2_016132 [Prunus campanulata]
MWRLRCSTETTQVYGEPKKPGHTISKGHKNYDLMLNLQLGIRYCIGKHDLIVRDLKPSNFNPKEKFWTSGQWFGAGTKLFRLNGMMLNLGRVHKDIRIWVALESDS